MSKQKQEKLTATATPEKLSLKKPLVQAEGELTEEQLEAIAGAGIRGQHNETLVSMVDGSQSNSQSEPEQIVELSEEDLEDRWWRDNNTVEGVKPTVTTPELYQLSVEQLNQVIGGKGIHDAKGPNPR